MLGTLGLEHLAVVGQAFVRVVERPTEAAVGVVVDQPDRELFDAVARRGVLDPELKRDRVAVDIQVQVVKLRDAVVLVATERIGDLKPQLLVDPCLLYTSPSPRDS